MQNSNKVGTGINRRAMRALKRTCRHDVRHTHPDAPRSRADLRAVVANIRACAERHAAREVERLMDPLTAELEQIMFDETPQERLHRLRVRTAFNRGSLGPRQGLLAQSWSVWSQRRHIEENRALQRALRAL